MATSLSEQLQKLAVPQTSLLKKDKKKASLLFDPKEAAGIRKNIFFQIGLEGFEELVAKNEVFESYRNSLFSALSKNFDRIIEDKNANEKLNKSIDRFLLLLSPYFALTCTHKALEFLIDRFMIHQFNRNSLILLALPYHETNIFVRVLQICEFKDQNDPLYFLKSLQKPGLHLTKQTLLVHSADHTAFLKLVTQLITNLVEVHDKPSLLTVAFNFYNTVFCGAIEYSNEVTEDQITQMVPAILTGLKSSVPDFTASCYVIVARLAAKTTLNDKLLNRLVELMSEVNCQSLKVEAVLALVILYQSQEQYLDMPKKAVDNLSKHDWLPKCLSLLSESGSNLDAFLKAFIFNSVPECIKHKTQQTFFINILNELRFDDDFIPVLLSSFLDGLNCDMTSYSTEVKEWFKEILNTVEKQYPTQFDIEIKNILNAKFSETSQRRKVCLQQILKYSTKSKCSSDVLTKLYHPSEEIRKEGIKNSFKNYQKLNESDQELLLNALIDKLNDDNPDVALKSLEALSKIKCLNDKLANGLFRVIQRYQFQDKTWKDTFDRAIELLCSNNEFSWEIFLQVFPFLLPGSTEEFNTAKHIISQPFFLKNKSKPVRTLHHSTISLKNSDTNLDIFAAKVIDNLSLKNETEIEEFINIINTKKYMFTRNHVNQYCAILILSEALHNSNNLALIQAALEVAYNIYTDSGETSFAIMSSESQYLKIARTKKFPVQGFLECVIKMIANININNINLSKDTEESRFFKLSLLIFFRDVEHCKPRIKDFLDIFSLKLHRKIDVLLNASNFEFSFNYVNNFLSYLIEELLGHKDFPNIKISLGDNTFLFLISLLLNVEKSVRQSTAKILQAFRNSALKTSAEWLNFVKAVLEHKKDLIMDANQTPLVLSKLLQKEEAQDILSTFISFVRNNACPSYIKYRVVYILAHIDNFAVIDAVCKVILDIVKENKKLLSEFCAQACEKIISNMNECIIRDATKTTNVYKFLENCLKSENLEVVLNNDKTNLRKLILTHYTNKDVLLNFNEEILKSLFGDFCKIYVETSDPDCVTLVNKIFKHIDLDASLIVHLLEKMRDVQSLKETGKKIRKQRKAVPTVDILDTLEWKIGTSVLELIQNKKKIKNCEILVSVLFDILKRCLEFDEQSAVEYPKQLILSTILLIGKKVGDLPEKLFDVESIVQCVRSSQNPQTHHHAMLVLAYIAKLVPDSVLQHIMAIFTFVGSSLLRHDDAYSTQVISQILDTTVPIFLVDNHKDKLVKVLSVFVNALLDVPEHRRLALYRQLLNNINPNENLYLFLLLVVDSYVLSSSKQKSGKGAETTKRLNIANSLCQSFEAQIPLQASIEIIEFLKTFPVDEKEAKEFRNKELLSFDNYTPKQLRHFRYTATTFVGSMLSSEHFVNQIATLNDEELFNLEKLFKDLIISVLTYIQKSSKISDNSRNSPQGHYWKVILHHSYDILDAVNALLPANMFLLVTKGLLVHNLQTVKRRALDLLNAKLHNNINLFDSCDKNEVYVLIPQVLSITELAQKDTLDFEQEILVQTALLSLKLFVKGFAEKDPEKFVEILKFVTNLLNLNIAQSNILASVILCLAELCVDLKAHAVACLSDFMPSFLKILKIQKHQETSNLLLLSVVTTIHKLLDSLPLFLSPYLGKILFETSILISKFGTETKDQKMAPFLNKLTNLKYKIGTTIPLRILLPSISSSYESLVKKKAYKGIISLMDILIEGLKRSNQTDITASLPDLTKFFLKALEFRSENLTNLETTNEIEKSLIKALTSLILKLSENIFRPFFYKLYDWAIRSTKQRSDRVITFYNITQQIAGSLKSLFVLFASEFLKNAVEILDLLNKSKADETYFNNEDKDLLLLEYILLTLNAIFEYDNQKFVNKDRFDLIMQPLVDQLENNLGGLKALTDRNEKLLTPTIMHFTLATAEDSLWKQMNYQILLKMRSSTSEIRLATLHCLTEVVVKLGEDFLPLLPETIPFLAELLEDEDEIVEKACRKAVQEMEKVLGEPLQKYF